jgi:hypothetical protein
MNVTVRNLIAISVKLAMGIETACEELHIAGPLPLSEEMTMNALEYGS